MYRQSVRSLATACALMLVGFVHGAGVAGAATVSFVPSTTSPSVGQPFTIDVSYDFTDLTSPVGGFAIDLVFPPGVLEFVDYVPSTTLPATGSLLVENLPTSASGALPVMRYTDFGAVFSSGGLTGAGSLGRFSVLALAPHAGLDLGVQIDSLDGDFRLYDSSIAQPAFHVPRLRLVASANGRTGGASVSPVPLPPSVVLFLGGLGLVLLVGSLRRERRRFDGDAITASA